MIVGMKALFDARFDSSLSMICVRWTEVSELLEDELLSVAELEKMWEALPKAPGASRWIDLEGFAEFARRVSP